MSPEAAPWRSLPSPVVTASRRSPVPHATGRWAKKIRQKLHDLAKISDDPKGSAALEQFQREWPYLSEGRTPPPIDSGDGCTLAGLCNPFLTSKLNAMRAGELTERSSRGDTLRHVFETIGGECRDQVAVNAIMGHVDDSMAAVYRERISDERLQAVVQTVHAWLWPDGS